MKKSKLDLNRIYKFCELLENEFIKIELDEYLNGYSLNNIEREIGKWICSLTNNDNNHITLIIQFNKISIIKNSNNTLERILIDENLFLTHKTIDKYKDEIIYSVIRKQFLPSDCFKKGLVLTDVTEDRYPFTKTNLEKLIESFDYDENKLEIFSLNKNIRKKVNL